MGNVTGMNRRAYAICWAVIDCGIQPWVSDEYGDRMVRELRIGFELSDENDKNGRKRVITRVYNRSFNKKASLYRDLISWLGVPYLGAERPDGRFDFAHLLRRGAALDLRQTWLYSGTPCWRIEAVHEAPAMHLCERDPVLFDLDRFDVEAFHQLPEMMRDHIMSSPTFLAMHGQQTSDPTTLEGAVQHNALWDARALRHLLSQS